MNQSFSQKLKGFLKSWEMVLICILVAEFVIFGAANDKFRPAMLFNSMNDFMSICIISLFVTFVMITGGIDIQAGSIVGLTSIIIGVTWQDFGFNIWAAAGFALLIAVNLWCIVRILRSILWRAGHGRYLGRQLPLFRNRTSCIQYGFYRKLSGYQRFPG
ncbi:MAG: hypothetical protein V8S36_08865 [Lachnospiraceae bacterium]